MKNNKAAGPYDQIVGTLRYTLVKRLFNYVIKNSRMPNDWDRGVIVTVQKRE